jgi:rSAM/selenodomain-associated transferase 1
MKRALIVVAKEPRPGNSKTRLVPPLSPQEAALLYSCMLTDTLGVMMDVDGVDRVLAYTPQEAQQYFRDVLPPGFELTAQRGDSLGERLDHVLCTHLEAGYGQAVVMDSDSPTLPPDYVQQAFQQLDRADVDVVLGPTEDGGYYLIGLKRPCAALFEVVMSTPTVLQETLELARAQGLRAACLPVWYDVDTPEDLERLRRELEALPERVGEFTRRLLYPCLRRDPSP